MELLFKDLDKMLVFGLNSKKEYVYIDDVENGNACWCVCPSCFGRLNAKNKGTLKAHHFAHAIGSGCGRGHERTLSLLTKRILDKEKDILLPPGNIFINNKCFNDCQHAHIKNVVVKDCGDYPPLVSIETFKGKTINVAIIFSDKDYFERMRFYNRISDNLIEMDIRIYKGSEEEVYRTLKRLLIDTIVSKKWVKRYDETAISEQLKYLSSWKDYGRDANGMLHFYCPRQKRNATSNEVNCLKCEYLSSNIDRKHRPNGCIGFIEGELKFETIMNAKLPDYSNIKEPSFFEMHGIERKGYWWFKLEDLPKAYPDKNYVLIHNEEIYKVFLVSLDAIRDKKLIGLEISSNGTEVEYDFLPNIPYMNIWRICSLSNYKIIQNTVEEFERVLNRKN